MIDDSLSSASSNLKDPNGWDSRNLGRNVYLHEKPTCHSWSLVRPATRVTIFMTFHKDVILTSLLGGGFKHFYFHPYLRKWSNLTNIFQMGWNHQLVCHILVNHMFRSSPWFWWTTVSWLFVIRAPGLHQVIVLYSCLFFDIDSSQRHGYITTLVGIIYGVYYLLDSNCIYIYTY